MSRLCKVESSALVSWFKDRLFGISLVAQQQRIHLPIQETRVGSLGQEDRLEKEMATHSNTTPIFLPGKSHGQKELGGLQSMESLKSRTQLSN